MKIKQHRAVFNEFTRVVELKVEHFYDVMFHTDWEDIKAGFRTTIKETVINDEVVGIEFQAPELVRNENYDPTLPDDYFFGPEFITVRVDYSISQDDVSKFCTVIPEGH